MRNLSWDGIALRYSIRRCASCGSGDHMVGWSHRGTVHWADRPMTRAGLRRFLMLLSTLYLLGYDRMPEWEAIYSRNVWAQETARRLRVRIPAKLADTDRARVAWLITKDERAPSRVKEWARVRSIR